MSKVTGYGGEKFELLPIWQSMDELLKLAGYTEAIDYAVPQQWLDKVHELGLKKPIGWIYDKKAPMMGRPLEWSEVLTKFRSNSIPCVLTPACKKDEEREA